MFSFVRGGPKIIVMETLDTSGRIEEYLLGLGKFAEITPREAIGAVGETSCLIVFCISDEEKGGTWVLSTMTPPETVLCGLINARLAHLLENVYSTPGAVVMRLIGDINKGIEEIQKNMGGVRKPYRWMFNEARQNDTVIYFTQQRLNKLVQDESFYPEVLQVPGSCSEVLAALRAKAVEYMSASMGTPDWNEVLIRIYDADGFYNLQYKRLAAMIEGMELGIIMEERWGKDHAMALMSVPVYEVRLFTPLAPDQIKKAAMALEYTTEGTRCVDMDVYHKNKKIYWSDENEAQGKNRVQTSMKLRVKIMDEINQDNKDELLRLEAELVDKKSY